MDVYSYKQRCPLRYSDFDFKDELSVGSLLALVQEAACMSADELGFGYDDLRPLGYGFLVVNTYCRMRRPVRLGETVEIETWPLPPRHVICERDYRVRTEGGEEVASLASRWCLVDLKEFKLLTPDKMGEAHAHCPYRAEKAVEVPVWKIPHLEGGREAYRVRVGNSFCDHYLHANNARYPEFFLNCFTMDELARYRFDAFRIAYVKQAKEGSELVFYRADDADGTTLEARLDGVVTTQMRFDYERGTKP